MPFGTPSLVGNADHAINVDTKSALCHGHRQLTATSIILNGGVRYDDYNSCDRSAHNGGNTSSTAVNSDFVNYNLGVVFKPLPIGSVYAAYATSTNPVGSEFDGTGAALRRPRAVLNGNPNQIFGPEKNKAIEIGTKWELFDRHLLVTAALFQTEKDNARENASTVHGVAGRLISAARPIRSAVSISTSSGKITDKWSVFGGLVLMQSKVTKSLIRRRSRCSTRPMSGCSSPTSRINRSAC